MLPTASSLGIDTPAWFTSGTVHTLMSALAIDCTRAAVDQRPAFTDITDLLEIAIKARGRASLARRWCRVPYSPAGAA